MVDLFVRLGIGEQVKGKVKQPPSGAHVGSLLATGEVELGFQQVSELIHVNGIQYLGPLPAELQHYTIYSGATHSQTLEPEVAQAFLKVLRQPETATAVKKSGMEPL